MKIIGTSNYHDPSVNDILICDRVNTEFAELIVETMNEGIYTFDKDGKYFFELVDDDYKLLKGD